jgi:D-arabinose 1-dehydrogenase-like Zn-dependent alcohol dehydrogenase
MGAEVTVLSQSLRTKDDGIRFGADHHYATSAPWPFVLTSFEIVGRWQAPCAEHDITPEVEVVSADQINDAFDRLARVDVRYLL